MTMKCTARNVLGGVAFGAGMLGLARGSAAQPAPMVIVMPTGFAPSAAAGFEDRADELYDEGREAIEDGHFERAVERFNRLIELK
jgi:hypothetical protein